MLKEIFSLAIYLLLSAQSASAIGGSVSFNFSALGGLSLSRPSMTGYQGSQSTPTAYRKGVTAGLNMDVSFVSFKDIRAQRSAGSFGVDLGVLYAQRGYTLANGSDVRMDWLMIPIYARYDLWCFRVLGGLYYAHGIGDIVIGTPSSAAANQTTLTTVTSWDAASLSSQDWGLLAGVGFLISPTLTVSGRYSMGETNLVPSGGGRLTNNAIDVLLEIGF